MMRNWSGHILVAEDYNLDYERIARALSRLNFQGTLSRARDGIEALEIMRSSEGLSRPMVVLADLNMPRLNGIELIATMRRDPCLRKIPVHVFTTSTHPNDVSRAWDASISGYHIKPSRLADMENLIQILISLWEQSQFDGENHAIS